MTMSIFFSRTAIIPVWLIVFGLFAWSGGPMPAATAALMLVVGLAVPVIILILGKQWPLTVAEVPDQIEASGKSDDALARLKPHHSSARYPHD